MKHCISLHGGRWRSQSISFWSIIVESSNLESRIMAWYVECFVWWQHTEIHATSLLPKVISFTRCWGARFILLLLILLNLTKLPDSLIQEHGLEATALDPPICWDTWVMLVRGLFDQPKTQGDRNQICSRWGKLILHVCAFCSHDECSVTVPGEMSWWIWALSRMPGARDK